MRYRRFNRAKWTLERERHQLVDRKPRPDFTPAQSMDDVMGLVMKDWGLHERLWEQKLLTDWPSLVGAQVANHSRPGRLDQKTLIIFVSNSVWLSELSRTSRPLLLKKLQAEFGSKKIKDLRFQLDPDPRNFNA